MKGSLRPFSLHFLHLWTSLLNEFFTESTLVMKSFSRSTNCSVPTLLDTYFSLVKRYLISQLVPYDNRGEVTEN